MPDWFEKGGPVMYPLLLCSFISIAIIVERCLFWVFESMGKKNKNIEKIFSLIKEKKLSEAQSLAKKSRDCAAKVLASGLESPSNGITQSMVISAAREVSKMGRFLPTMNTLITLTPLLGILGTVIGIIHSFDVLGASAIVDPRGVTKGVAEALITTAFGLTIAIWTLIPYNHFSQKTEEAHSRLEEVATRLEVVMSQPPPAKK